MRGSEFDRLSHGMCSRHDTQHMPRLRLAPVRAHARFRVAVAELAVVRRCYALPFPETITAQTKIDMTKPMPIYLKQTFAFTLIACISTTAALADASLRAYTHIDVEDGSSQFVDLYAPPLSLSGGLVSSQAFGGGTAVADADFGAARLETTGFFDYSASTGVSDTAGNRFGSVGALSFDDLTIDAVGLTGQGGFLVSRVQLTGKGLNRDFSVSGAGYFKAGLTVSYGFSIAGGGHLSAGQLSFTTSDGFNSIGTNGSTPTVGGARLDQTLTSTPTAFTFGAQAAFGMWASSAAWGTSTGAPDTDAHSSWNFGTAADPILVEWAGIDVYDSSMRLVSTYSAESSSGYDYSQGEAVPEPSSALMLALGAFSLLAARRRTGSKA